MTDGRPQAGSPRQDTREMPTVAGPAASPGQGQRNASSAAEPRRSRASKSGGAAGKSGGAGGGKKQTGSRSAGSRRAGSRRAGSRSASSRSSGSRRSSQKSRSARAGSGGAKGPGGGGGGPRRPRGGSGGGNARGSRQGGSGGRRARKPARRRWKRRALATLLVLPALVVGFAGLVLFFYFFIDVPLPEDIGKEPTVVLDTDGQEISTLQARASREHVALTQLPTHVVDAVLAAEDEGFYRHAGISLPGVFRAAVMNVVSGEISQGGSTISQQYIKNVTNRDAQTVIRKIREAALAVKLEQRFSKNEILEFYLNSIYFGRGAYGIQAAAQAYFHKNGSQLTQAEAIQLAGIIPAPSAYNPAQHPEAAHARFNYVRGQLIEQGELQPGQVPSPPEVEPAGATQFNEVPFFLDMVRKELTDRFGKDAYEGLTVTTTLDLDAQQAAEEAYAEAFADIEPTGALVALDTKTGGIRALVGGEDTSDNQLNLATRARQPGSTFKPFALATWVSQGMSPDNYFKAPAEISLDVKTQEEPWEPSNYGGVGYDKKLSLREGTWYSVNTVYAQLVMEIGLDEFAALARRAGVGERMPEVPSTVLGTHAVTPLELATGYNTFATGGIRRDPVTIQQIKRDGEVVYELSGEGERAFSEQVAWTVTDVLRGVVEKGTGTAADIARPVAGKTGTSQGYGNAWFAGYSPQLTAVVWMGYRDSNRTMPGEPTGGELPARAWSEFMSAVHEGLPVESFPAPSGSLLVTRPKPPPEPTAEDCAEDEKLATGEDGRAACVPKKDAEKKDAEDGEGKGQDGDGQGSGEGEDADGGDAAGSGQRSGTGGQGSGTDGQEDGDGSAADSGPDSGSSSGGTASSQPLPSDEAGSQQPTDGDTAGTDQSGGGQSSEPSSGASGGEQTTTDGSGQGGQPDTGTQPQSGSDEEESGLMGPSLSL